VKPAKAVLRAIGIATQVALVSFASNAGAYEVDTHRDMTGAAVLKSRLADLQLLQQLGLKSVPIDDLRQSFVPSDASSPLSIIGIIRFGARWEDDLSKLQALRHFYDPVYERALDVAPSGTANSIKSPDWALEDIATYNGPVAAQIFSLRDARNYLYEALTYRNPASVADSQNERRRKFGLTFQTLGHVMHHLQDMAQPQHVRNEPHCDDEVSCRPLADLLDHKEFYAPSLYEKYTNEDGPALRVRANLPFFAQGSDPTYPGPLAADGAMSPRRFWRTSPPGANIAAGRGIAEYTNRNFYSAATIGTYPSPPAKGLVAYAEQATRADFAELLPGSGVSGTMRFWSTDVYDAITGETQVNQRALSEGIMDSDIARYYSTTTDASVLFALNRFTFEAAHKFLIPRAVAYSAGLINYFFRGYLEITPPDEGVYAIVDHSTQESGFGKLKLKLRNITPGANDATGQAQVERVAENGSATLVAVVKFHRNNCYAFNLSGEYGSPGIAWDACRSPAEEIVVSTPRPVPRGVNDAATLVQFTFPEEIPPDATDIFLQVVYRGPLGNEADAVAVATKDIAEPLYLTHYSVSDQSMYAQFPIVEPGPYTFEQWCLQGYSTYDECRNGMAVRLRFRFGASPGYTANPLFSEGEWHPLASAPPFDSTATLSAPVGTYARVALLADGAPRDGIFLWEWVNPQYSSLFQWNRVTLTGNRNQLDPDTNTLTPSTTYVAGRGIYVPSASGTLLNGGNAPSIPPLQPVVSQIVF